jgi:hypothetical protein
MATSSNIIPSMASMGSDIVKEAKSVFDSIADENSILRLEAFTQWFIKHHAKVKRPIDAVKGSSSEPASKKQKSSTIFGAPQPSSTIVPKAKLNALLKALVSTLKASIKSKKWYDHPANEECNAETVMSEAEFEHIFGKIGKIKEGAKASSILTNKIFTSEETAQVFGTLVSGLKTMTYNKPWNFCKQVSPFPLSILLILYFNSPTIYFTDYNTL